MFFVNSSVSEISEFRRSSLSFEYRDSAQHDKLDHMCATYERPALVAPVATPRGDIFRDATHDANQGRGEAREEDIQRGDQGWDQSSGQSAILRGFGACLLRLNVQT